jgi:hypothetical protein
MSTKNKPVVSDAILEMRKIKDAMERTSTETIKSMLSESVKNAIRENIESEDYVIIEGKKASKDSDVCEDDAEVTQPEGGEDEAPEGPEAQEPEAGAETPEGGAEEGGETPEEGEGAEDDVDTTQYQVDGDPNTLDLTGEQDPEKVMKVYKLLQPDDDVVIRKTDNGKVELKDGQTGAEYVIDLGTDEGTEGEEAAEGGAEAEQLAEEYEFELSDESVPYTDDPDEYAEDLGIEDGDEPEDEGEPYEDEVGCEEGGCMTKKINEKTSKKCMKNQEMMFEVDLGYTDNYQDKDPIAGLSNQEVAPNGARNIDKGVPTGTKKPWSGLSQKENPYEDKVNEEEQDECGMVAETEGAEVTPDMGTVADEQVDEATNVGGAVQQRSNSKSHIPTGRKEHGPKPKRHVSAGNEYHEKIEEMQKKMDEILKENKLLKDSIALQRKELRESYVTNVNLGKITKLFLENTTSQKEKIDIVNRFVNEAKTVKQSEALYESINKELKKAGSKVAPITEATMKVESAPINETKIYESEDFKNMKDLMKRVMSC